jgi:DTW domain-containing protein YfiP
LQVEVLMHFREQWRPSSTGRLIERAMVGTRRHVFRKEVPIARESVVAPGREFWILHPRGQILDASAQLPSPDTLQVLLLDGSWGETRNMVSMTEDWGRLVQLPLAGESRYWLRAQQGDGRQSTVEALMGLLRLLGLGSAAAQIALHFELQVYASLQARGQTGLPPTTSITLPSKRHCRTCSSACTVGVPMNWLFESGKRAASEGWRPRGRGKGGADFWWSIELNGHSVNFSVEPERAK